VTALYRQIDGAAPPERSALKPFVHTVVEQIKPFIDYKARLGEAQRRGELRSLVWPLFFDRTRHEAERWARRLVTLAGGESELERAEVVPFWANIMEEHARFVAHLLDPDEYALLEEATQASRVFQRLGTDSLAGAVGTTVAEPGTVAKPQVQNPEMDAVMSAARTILDFKTERARDIEAGRIRSIDPRLADHVRREALKFADELKRAH
jgi:hypothetical protein